MDGFFYAEICAGHYSFEILLLSPPISHLSIPHLPRILRLPYQRLTHLIKLVIRLRLPVQSWFYLAVAVSICGHYSECVFLGPEAVFGVLFFYCLVKTGRSTVAIHIQSVNKKDGIVHVFFIHFVGNR